MTTLAGLITAALLNAIWQDVILAAALAAALFLLRRASPQARYIAACAAFALMTVVPLTTAAIVDAGGAGVPLRTSGAAAASVLPTVVVEQETPVHRPSTWEAELRAWALPIWCLGVLVFSVRLAGSGMHAAALRRRGHAAEPWLVALVARVAAGMGVHHPIDVIVPSGYPGAATVGWVRPAILMPAAIAIGLPVSQVEALIAHEVAHIRRHDYLVNLAQLVVETIYFYHPAIWWVSRRIRAERELCCDDAAVAWSGDAHAYARALTTVAASLPQPAMAASGGSLVRRVERLLGVPAAEPWLSRRTGLAALVVTVLLVGGGSAWMDAQQSPRASAGGATLSGTVYDPLDGPAEHTPIALSAGSFVQESTTDGGGHFKFEHLSPGRYTFSTPITDAFVPAITLTAGEDRKMDVRLRVEEVVVDVEVCDGCRQVGAIRAPLAASAPGIPKNPLIVQAEPVEGWDAFNASTRQYPASLKAHGVDGTVVVDGRIGVDGAVEHPQARVTDSGFHGAAAQACVGTPGSPTAAQMNRRCVDELSAAAVALVQSERWHPAMVRATPVDVPLHVTVEYTLAGK